MPGARIIEAAVTSADDPPAMKAADGDREKPRGDKKWWIWVLHDRNR
jgi:hypothetical protein